MTASTARQRARRPRGEPVVQRVFEVTLAHLAARGFANLSVPEIAEEARVNKTSVYRRWPTKEDLVRAALDASLEHDAPLPDTGSLREDMLTLAEAALRFTQSPRGLAVLRTMLAEGAQPEVSAIAGKMLDGRSAVGPRALLSRAIERGELRPDADVRLILSVIAGAVMHRLLVEQSRLTRSQLEQLVDLILHGVASPRAPDGRPPRGSRP